MCKEKFLRDNVISQIGRFKDLEQYGKDNNIPGDSLEKEFFDKLCENTEDITLGTYNSESDETHYWELTDDNILEMIRVFMTEVSFNKGLINNNLLLKEEYEQSSMIENIHRFLELSNFEFFTIGDRLYTEQVL